MQMQRKFSWNWNRCLHSHWFDTEENNRGYRLFDDEHLELDEATQKCQKLGARLPVLSDTETIKIVKKYIEAGDFEVYELKYLFY